MKIARDFMAVSRPNGIFLDDDEIFSAASWALVDAGLRYEPYCAENGYDPTNLSYFQAFLSRCIKGAMYDHVRSIDYVTRETRELSSAIRTLKAQNKTREEICKELSIADSRYSTALASVTAVPWSLNYEMQIQSEGLHGHTLNSFVADIESSWASPEVDNDLSGESLLSSFAQIVRSLTESQQLLLALKYYSGMEMANIALCLGISSVAVQKMHTEVIMTIQERMEAVCWKMGAGK